MAELDKPASAAQNAILTLLDAKLHQPQPELILVTYPAVAQVAAEAAIKVHDREVKARLLSDEILTAFEMHGRTISMSPPGAVELEDLRDRMTTAISRAFDA